MHIITKIRSYITKYLGSLGNFFVEYTIKGMYEKSVSQNNNICRNTVGIIDSSDSNDGVVSCDSFRDRVEMSNNCESSDSCESSKCSTIGKTRANV